MSTSLSLVVSFFIEMANSSSSENEVFLMNGELIFNQLASETDLLISVDPDRQSLIDSLGRERIFHGSNVVNKQPPFHPKTEGLVIISLVNGSSWNH